MTHRLLDGERPAHPRKRFRKPTLLVLLAALPALMMVFFTGSTASAHGAPMEPGSRTFLCAQHSKNDSGAMVPTSPACKAAMEVSGASGFYNWFSVLRSDGAGRMAGFIPDGQLCSGGNTGGQGYNFAGFDLPRNDWPYTHLTSGASMRFSYNAWAAHPGTFYLYVTKDGYNPTQPLGWDDLEAQPFSQVTNPPMSGSVGTLEGKYSWTANLPSGKSGKHIIYMVWSRSDSTETFYSCSDVVFDGGNGQVTYPGADSGDPGDGDPGDGDPGDGDPGDGDPGDGDPGTDPDARITCDATVNTVSTWNNGYQAAIIVKNTGDTAISNWMLHWNMASGDRIDSLWNGQLDTSGTAVTVTNAAHNGSLAPGATAEVGFVGTGSPPSAASCMIH